MGVSCELYPKVADGSDSVLYKELLKKTNNRPLTNLIYASYLIEEVAAQMDAGGKKRNKQGQHNAEDVYRWFKVSEMTNEAVDIVSISTRIGSKNSSNEYIIYQNSEDALEKAVNFNNESENKGAVAYVVKKDNGYIIIVEPKNATNQIKVGKNLENYKALQKAKELLNNAGYSLGDISNNEELNSLVDLSNIKTLFASMSRIQKTANRYLSIQDIELLLTTHKNDPRIQRLFNKLGVSNIHALAEKIYEFYSTTETTISNETAILIGGLLNESKKFSKLDLPKAIEELNAFYTDFQNTNYEYSVQKVIDDLNSKYRINRSTIVLSSKDINSVTEVLGEVILKLSKQIKELERKKKDTEEVYNLSEQLRDLTTAFESKQYYYGCLLYLTDALSSIDTLKALQEKYLSISGGSDLEKGPKQAEIIMEMKSIIESNKAIIKALYYKENMLTEVGLTKEEISTIKSKARIILDFYEGSASECIKDIATATMVRIVTPIFGTEGINGVAVANIVNSASKDASIFDWVYCASKLTDPLSTATGTIIRNAQDSRDIALNKMRARIQRATYRLNKAGHSDTSFMYGEDGYIISDINWKSYWKARNKYKHELLKSGVKGIELKDAIEQWEYDNLEDRVVDSKSGRTERVPNHKYRKEFPNLTEAQKEYYDTMMQIKGELGTLLPEVAQKQYVPPQIRKDFLDRAKGGFPNIWRAVKMAWKGLYTIFEDDSDFVKSGVIIDNEELGIATGDIYGEVKKEIPIRYLNRITDQSDLLKDFSGAIQMFAGTAINYSAMNEIASTVEFMYEFVKGKSTPATEDGIELVEVASSGDTNFIKRLTEEKGLNTSAILRQQIDSQVYGIKSVNQGKWAQITKKFLTFSSIKALSVNVKGALSNLVTGELNALIEAGAGEYFTVLDYLWAKKRLFGDITIGNYGRAKDLMTNTTSSFDVLLSNQFDAQPGRFNSNSRERYHSTLFRKVLGGMSTMPGYAIGEWGLAQTTMYAILHKEKALLNGKEVSLFEVFDKTEEKDGVSELIIKDGATDLDGNPITLEGKYLDSIRKRIRVANESMHGAMSEESRGIIHRHIAGKLIMHFRQWMVEFYRKRFGGKYFDGSTKQERMGYYREMYYIIKDMFTMGFIEGIRANNKENNPRAYYNARRFATEMFITFIALPLLSLALGDPEDHDDEWLYKMGIYLTRKSLLDMRAGNPIGMIMGRTIQKMINTPIPSMSTLDDTLYPITGILNGDIFTEYEKSGNGYKKGDNIYLTKLPRKCIPFYKQIEEIIYFDEENEVFKYIN